MSGLYRKHSFLINYAELGLPKSALHPDALVIFELWPQAIFLDLSI